MPAEYTITTPRPATPATSSLRNFGVAFLASGLLGVAIGIVNLSYPAAVPKDRWSYPFDATSQWVVSSVLSITHLLAIAGLVGVLIASPYGRSRAARIGIWAAIIGCAGLAGCELLSGAVGTRNNNSSFAGAVNGAFGVASLLTAAGSIVAGVVIVRRVGRRSGWSAILWSGVVLVVLVTPASIGGNLVFETVALTLWSLLYVPLGQALIRSRGVVLEDDGLQRRSSFLRT
ncbi:MAG TPA: hypothetical protein VGD55_12785, partial [Acidothermaceae bacterium]